VKEVTALLRLRFVYLSKHVHSSVEVTRWRSSIWQVELNCTTSIWAADLSQERIVAIQLHHGAITCMKSTMSNSITKDFLNVPWCIQRDESACLDESLGPWTSIQADRQAVT